MRPVQPPTERRGWQAFWALPVIMALLLAVHGGRFVERIYLPISVLLALYLSRKFPRVYVAFVLLASTISPLVNRIAAEQSVLLPKSPILAAPFLIVAVSALWMWRARLPGYRALAFLLPLLAVFYGIGVGILTIGPRSVVVPAAGWLCPIFFGLYCYAHEDAEQSLARMYLRSIILSGAVLALYGLVQYWSPFQWDLDWLQQLQDQGAALSMGKPEPFGIRIFSTVSSPAAAAVFLASAFLAVSSIASRWRIPAMACTLVTLVLTSVRAAWLAFAIAAVILLSRASAKARLQAVAGVVALVLVTIAAGQTEQGDKVLERFNTFGNLKKDHSLRDREIDIRSAWAMVQDRPFGGGLGYTLKAKDVRFSAVDVGAVAIPIEIGWFGTLLYTVGLLIAVSTTQLPEIRKGGRFLSLALMSLLPLLLLTDENLLSGYGGILFFAPTAFLMQARARERASSLPLPGAAARSSGSSAWAASTERHLPRA